LLLCFLAACYLHRTSGGSINTYLRVTFSHSNPNIVVGYLPDETRRKMQQAIANRRTNMPPIGEELGLFKKRRKSVLDEIEAEGYHQPSMPDPPAAQLAPAAQPVALPMATVVPAAEEHEAPMPTPGEAQPAYIDAGASASAMASAMAAMSAAELSVPPQGKAGPIEEEVYDDPRDDPYDDGSASGGGRRRRKKRPPPPGSSNNSGDVTPADFEATGGVYGDEYDDAAGSFYQEGEVYNEDADAASSATGSGRRRRKKKSGSDGSSAAGAEDDPAAAAMVPATPSDLQTPGEEEEEDEEEMIRRLAWIKFYVKNGETNKALELGWDGDMSFIAANDAEPQFAESAGPGAGAGGSALTVDPQKTMCRI